MEKTTLDLGHARNLYHMLTALKQSGALASDTDMATAADVTCEMLTPFEKVCREREEEKRQEYRAKTEEGHEVFQVVGGPKVAKCEDGALRYLEGNKIGEEFAESLQDAQAPLDPVYDDEDELNEEIRSIQEDRQYEVKIAPVDFEEQYKEHADLSKTYRPRPEIPEQVVHKFVSLRVLEPWLDGLDLPPPDRHDDIIEQAQGRGDSSEEQKGAEKEAE